MGKRKAPGQSKTNKETIINLPVTTINNIKHIIFNACLSTGHFPIKFKNAIIKIIPKPKKDNTQPLNYRPISLLENVGKVLEKVTDQRLRHHLEINNLHNKAQHCGRPHRGTNTAIAAASEEIAHSQQVKGLCNVVLRDVSKAFDKVWHKGLK